MHNRFQTALWCCCCAWMVTSGSVFAGDAPALPGDPSVWINSSPLSVQRLKGKAIFLWFYEETSPVIRDRWASLMETSQRMSGDPIVFIAVNSGNAPSDIRGYAESLNISWPIIADVDRSLEKAFQVQEINQQNVVEACYISAEGDLREGAANKLDETIANALRDAAWKLDPAQVPDSLKETWRAVELGNFKAAGAGLKKSLASPKKDISEAAKKLQSVIKKSAADDVEAAKSESEAGHHWRAYELCLQMTDQYAPPDLPPELAELKKTLLKEADVKSGAVAKKAVDTAMKGLNSGKALPKKIKTQIEKIGTDFPDSDLARDAQTVLQRASESQQ